MIKDLWYEPARDADPDAIMGELVDIAGNRCIHSFVLQLRFLLPQPDVSPNLDAPQSVRQRLCCGLPERRPWPT